MIKYSVYFNGELTKSYELDEPVIFIGRLPENNIPISNMGVSRRHVKIELDPYNAYTLTDLNSLNGTLVNGKKVKKVTLCHGDKITIGKHTIIYEDYRPESAPHMETIVAEFRPEDLRSMAMAGQAHAINAANAIPPRLTPAQPQPAAAIPPKPAPQPAPPPTPVAPISAPPPMPVPPMFAPPTPVAPIPAPQPTPVPPVAPMPQPAPQPTPVAPISAPQPTPVPPISAPQPTPVPPVPAPQPTPVPPIPAPQPTPVPLVAPMPQPAPQPMPVAPIHAPTPVAPIPMPAPVAPLPTPAPPAPAANATPDIGEGDLTAQSGAVLIETSGHIVYKLDRVAISIGSDAGDDVYAVGVSKGFAVIEHSGGEYRIILQKAMSKIKVNGKNVKTHKLEHRDRIEIGSNTFRFMENG